MYTAIVEVAVNVEKFRNYDLSFLGFYYFSITLHQEIPGEEDNYAFAYHIHPKSVEKYGNSETNLA